MNPPDMAKVAKESSKRREMSLSQSLLSKKGPLGAIWVAGYSLNRLSRDQIAQSDVPSSVDKILIDEWPSVPYRILAYLLLGVVRVYSKKVEYVFEDCRKIINELRKFVDKRKASSFREVVHLRDFFISLPESYELDAFNLELADDASKQQAHVAKKEDITLQCVIRGSPRPQPPDSFRVKDSFKKEKSAKYVIDKYHRGVARQQTTTSIAYKATPTKEQEADPSAQNPPESAVETEASPSFFVHLEKIISSIYKEIHAETSSSEYLRSVETSSIEELREIRFSREECQDFEQFYQNDKDHLGIFGSSSIIQSASFEHSDLIRMMQNEANGLFHADADDVIHRVEVNPDLHTPSGNSDNIFSQEKEANFCLKLPPNKRGPFAAEVEVNSSITTSPDPCVAPNNFENVAVSAMREVTPTLESNGSKESQQPDGCSSAVPRKEKPTLTVQITPDSRNPSFKGSTHKGSRDLLAVLTPAKSEYVRRASKRKCLYDDPMVISNRDLKDMINDASGLARKRSKVPHTSLAILRLSYLNDLPQKFMEPLIPCIVIDPSDIRKDFKNVIQVETVQTSNKQVMTTSPKSATDCTLTIAPGTPVPRTASTQAFENPKAADSDGEETFLSVGSTSRAASDEECDTNPMDEEIDPNGDGPDGEERDGWSAKTRAVASWLHRIFKTRTKRIEAGTANLSGIMVGKTRKECARVFYEILVLGSKGFVNVTQKGSYGDILLRETTKMEGKLAHI